MSDKPTFSIKSTGVSYGNSPEVDKSDMEANNRVITSVEQGIELTNTDIYDARNLIKNARRITAVIQGQPPHNPKTLKEQGKGWKRNISTRFLQKELNRAAPRLYMPILTASTMTAAELPAGWPKGQEKTQFFRNTMTSAIRSWRKNDMFWRGIKQEVVNYGFAFAVWTNPYEWRPHMCRMDRGFVPKGTEVMDDQIARFTLKWDYRPDELLKTVRMAVDAGSDNWNKDAVAAAVDAASMPTSPQDMSQLRKWEEMTREAAVDKSTTRAQRMIQARHFFVLEFSGKVSHYILWPDGPKDYKMLFEHLDAYKSMDEVVIPMVFNYGDGTIHGSWGAGQLLFDLANQVERVRCDSMDNLLNSNKARLQVKDAKDAASAQLVVNDTMIIATGAQFAQNVGGISGDPQGYLLLDDRMSRWAQEIVGSYLPPLPSQASKAATDIASQAIDQEQQVQKDVLENSLKQDALVISNMTKRMLNEDSDDEFAIAVRKGLLGEIVGNDLPPQPISINKIELNILMNQSVVRSVSDFTEFAAIQRGSFASSVQNNPLFNQASVASYMANGVQSAGNSFAASIVVPEGDMSTQTEQQRQQLIENAAMMMGTPLPVVINDQHEIHLQALKQPLEQAIQGGLINPAEALLAHSGAHFAAGLSTKTLNSATTNEWKAWIATVQRALEAKKQEISQQQQQAQIQPGQMPIQ